MKTIYGIYERSTDICKYIGATNNFARRKSEHILAANKKINKDIYKWMSINEFYFKELCVVENNMYLEAEESISKFYNNISPLLQMRFGSSCTESLKSKISNGLTGKNKSSEQIEKLKKYLLSDKNTNRGRRKERVSCPHCGKIDTVGRLKQRHFNNCKDRVRS